MDASFYEMPDGPELRAYLAAETGTVEQLLALADACEAAQPAKAMQLRVMARRRANEIMAVFDWLHLQ